MTEQNTLPQRSPAASSGALSRRDRSVITLLLVSAFVVILNETVMGVALPNLMADFGIEAHVGQWLTTAFLLTMAVVIPITGFLIQRLTTRTLFGTAMILFSLGTLAAAVAPTFEVLLVGRVIQASGTAVMMPLLMTTVMTLVAPAHRGRMMGNISIVISVAPAVGPTVSGLILEVLNWRFIFWLVLPIAVASLILGLSRMKNVGEHTEARIDPVSVVLSIFGFGGVVYALSSLGEGASGTPLMPLWLPFVVGGLGLALFIARQIQLQRSDRALLDLRTFRSRTFSVAVLLMAAMMMALFGTIILLPIYLQTVLGLQPVEAGLLLLPGGLLMGLAAPFVGRAYDRLGARPLLVPGTIMVAAALWTLALLSAQTTPTWTILAVHVFLSAGLALTFTPLFTAGLGSVEPRLYSHGSAIVGTAQQLAGAAGTTLFVSVMTVGASSLLATGASEVQATAGGVHTAFFYGAAISTLGIVGAFFVRPAPRGADAPAVSQH
jgi:DHA2 family lincomycin resistance protein-like MFS transporter